MSRALHFGLQVIRGERRGLIGALARGALRTLEPTYSGIITGRNRLFDHGILASRRLPRVVVSVGNITTGGTGKTPVVRWLVEELRRAGHRPAILLRGYKVGGS